MAQTTVEILYPEFGNQAGDNGNAMYLRACLPHATFIETAFGEVPAFATRDDLSLVLLCGMTERQQERVLEALMPYRDRLAELADAGVPMLFTGNAVELLGNMIITPEGRGITGLGLFDIVTHQLTPQRFTGVGLGTFEPAPGADPIDIVGCNSRRPRARTRNVPSACSNRVLASTRKALTRACVARTSSARGFWGRFSPSIRLSPAGCSIPWARQMRRWHLRTLR